MPATLTTSSPPTAAPWFGRPHEHRHALIALAGSLIACAIYWYGTTLFAPDYVPGVVEFCGTATSLWCVWITQRRNVLALPIGIVSVALMGWFFFQIGLKGQGWLHWGYYVPVQFWAWQQWTRGGDNDTELLVSWLTNTQRVLCIGAIILCTLALGWVLNAGYDTALYTYWDASIVGASVVAMVLLAQKKVESWWLWILPVNVSAIILYAKTGAMMFSALYLLFLVMAFVGLLRWQRATTQAAA